VAKADNQVIGGLTAYIIDQYYSEKPLVYIYDLAVLEEYRRRGIAKSLIKYFTDFCKEKGFEEVFVQADRVDEEALSFYRSTGANVEEDVIHFTYSLK
jgi:aminoglycoside 3-N-acetyltransferase I